MKKVPTPTLDRMLELKAQSQQLGEFLDWLMHESGLTLCEYHERGDIFLPTHQNIEQVLAKFLDIDLDAAEKERQALLESLR